MLLGNLRPLWIVISIGSKHNISDSQHPFQRGPTFSNKIDYPISGTFISFSKNQQLRIIAKKILRDFWALHPDSEQQLKAWYQESAKAVWDSTNNIKSAYPSASFLPGNRVVFNIKGNHYRLIVKISYDYQMIWIRFIGTHAEYDKINATTI